MPFLEFPNLYLKVSAIMLSFSEFSGKKGTSPWHCHFLSLQLLQKNSYHAVVEKCHARFIYCQIPLSQTSATECFALCTDLIGKHRGVNGDLSASSIK